MAITSTIVELGLKSQKANKTTAPTNMPNPDLSGEGKFIKPLCDRFTKRVIEKATIKQRRLMTSSKYSIASNQSLVSTEF
jgi:hypothetical protein